MKFLLKLVLIVSVLFSLCACKSNDDARTYRKKPSRDEGVSSKAGWSRPTQWEGGLPGMGTGGMPNQY